MKLQAQNKVHHMSYFCFKIALELTYVHLGLPKKFSGGFTPDPRKGEGCGGERERDEGKQGGKRME